MMGTPIALSMNYTNPCWHRYNEGLTKLTQSQRSKGPILAKKAGHFIQRDDPELVAHELCELLDRVVI